MRTRSPDKRRRQRAVRAPTYRIENEYNPEATPQYFQISVNVLEGRKFAWSNPQSPNSYVLVILGKKKHRTSVRRNMEEPYYREFFVFEMYASISEVKHSSLWLAVMEPRCCVSPHLLGETNIDLGAIWVQPNHQIYHKWVQLGLPRDPAMGPVGFLKVDISIIFRGEVHVMSTLVSDKMEDNLLLPPGSEQQRANYMITVYGAFSLPTNAQYQNDRHFGKPPNTFVRASFCGLMAKTAVQLHNNNPFYCEQISMVEMFPNMSQVIRLEVCGAEGCYNRVLASTNIKLGQISHDGENGFLPTFGPSLLHMYGASGSATLNASDDDGPFHRGALLVALKTIVPYYQQGIRTTCVEPIPPINPNKIWVLEDFCAFCPILEVSMLDRRLAGKLCGVALSIGELPSENRGDEEFLTLRNDIKQRKLHYTGSLEVMKSKPVYGYLDFPHAFPVLQLATRLPDFRFRMYRNNMVYGIVAELELVINGVEKRLKNFEYISPNELIDDLNKAIDDTAGNILKFLDIIRYSGSATSSSESLLQMYSTELDQKQLAMQKEEIEKIYQQISTRTKGSYSTMYLVQTVSTDLKCNQETGTRKSVKVLLAETKMLATKLKKLIYKNSEGWPDVVIWLLNGGSRVAFCKISTSDVIYSVISEQCGKNCGRIQTIFLKPLKCPRHMNSLSTACYCIAGKVELLMWMGLYRQKSAFDNYIPVGYRLKLNEYMCLKAPIMIIECRAFIYQAKLSTTIDGGHITHPFVRINVLNSVKETKAKEKSLTPVWNQVLKMQKMIFCTPEKLVANPPTVLVEVKCNDMSGKVDLIGRIQIQPVVDDRQEYEYAPKMQWYEIQKGVESVGQILMSIQLLQIPEKLLKTTLYGSVENASCFAEQNDDEGSQDEIEPLPFNLVPKSTNYKVDVYWWGLRDISITRKPCVVLEIDDLIIKSDIIVDKKTNCNFPNGRTTQTFEAPLNEIYSPPLSIKLYDSSTFGRTLFLGTNIVKNPNKYIVDWLPKNERESSLKSVSIISSNVSLVNQRICTKKINQDGDECNSTTSIKNNCNQSKAKRSKWKRLFCKKEPEEEEYTLLPVFTKEKDQTKVARKNPRSQEQRDWWLRFLCSQMEHVGEEKTNITDKITIYDSELESQPEFSKFKDWCSTLKLYNGMKTGIPEKDEQLYCGFLKAGIAIYRWPPPNNTIAVSSSGVELNRGYFTDYPLNEPAKFLVRVYIVKAINLVPKDFSGKSDPYVIIKCGKKQLGDRNAFVPKTINPVFGKMYECCCTLPEDYQLTVSVFDHDSMSTDELIGSTVLDLEDRVYTKHKARVGLSMEYCLTGANKWRDCVKPSATLYELCSKNHLPPPKFPDSSTVIVNGIEYKDVDREKMYTSAAERKENICLNLLHKWYTLPICGYHLVPEHVETRSLYNPSKPGIDQGKILMWVDILPLDAGTFIPQPLDITPRKTEEYELRVIIWDVHNILLEDVNSPGKKASDIYVKAWIGSTNQEQHTDVHHRSFSGEGNFNWRMIFHFHYQQIERKLVLKDKGPFTEVEEHIPPILVVQVTDSDAMSPDDFLGSLTLNLNEMPRGSKLARHCALEATGNMKKVNLFSMVSIRAWWPLKMIDCNTGKSLPAGVVDMELTLLPKEKALLMPVGLGRDPPSPLPEPHRPEASLLTKSLTVIMSLLLRQSSKVLLSFCICVMMFVTIFTYKYKYKTVIYDTAGEFIL